MQPKKNEKVDLTKNSSLYFVIGLSFILLVSWQAIEWKTYKKTYGYEALNVEDDDDEEIPITEQIKTPPPPPPPPPPAPEVIEIVEDEEEVEETVIESTETDEEEIVEIVEVEEEEVDIDVPFAVIEDVPIFPGCERVKKSERRNCFQEKMNKHIRKNFRYPEIAQEMGIQGRVYVNFIISKDGSITNIRMRGPDKNLEGEAQRIISKLPKMTPGKQRGRPVRVPFSIPITFRLQ
ncbi:MAG: energy transducer TonB [Flavobacteriaceae bacterium]|nr:energy transducer TonB [Flavobacteriaceae bacterium]|tara:strand:+ start:25632 stop:26336 length:705 start_codon:yes stop_codon:yes gene_type:complete